MLMFLQERPKRRRQTAVNTRSEFKGRVGMAIKISESLAYE